MATTVLSERESSRGLDTRLGRNRDLFFRSYVLLACLGCAIGGVILTGRSERFSGPAFRGPRDLVDWIPLLDAWVCWGVLFLLYGLTLGLAMKRAAAVHVLRFGLVVYTFLALTLAVSVLREPTVAAIGCVLCMGFAALSLIMSDHLECNGWEE